MPQPHTLKINEIFYSIQGEGSYAGTPMVFVRVAGCNLRCSWCDQPDTIMRGFVDRNDNRVDLKYDFMDEHGILSKVKIAAPGCRRVCITGGEPTVHKLGNLIDELVLDRYILHLETNGTNFPNWVRKIHWVTCSPKREGVVHPDMRSYANEFKFIVDQEFSAEELDFAVELSANKRVFMQGCNYQDYIDYSTQKFASNIVLEHPSLRLGVQLHKYLGVR